MSKIRDRGEKVRRFLLENIDEHRSEIVKLATDKFGCTRQAVHKHLRKLINEGAVIESGKTRNKSYALAPLVEWTKSFPRSGLSEGDVWLRDVSPSLGSMADNVLSIWHYGFTEMLNNAIEHSDAKGISVQFKKNAASTEVRIYDDGVGIFKKIQAALGLLDERHAVLELAKGKFTTDPANHSGEGIFFTSRMFDDFVILSGGVYFSHQFDQQEDWILESQRLEGTYVRMVLNNHTSRTTRKIFDMFSIGEDYGFLRTVVPVKLTQYGDDNLVSRSQAKRLLARVDRFRIVVFDFAGVAVIGQAFADEVFRVFHRQHPEVELQTIHANSEVKRMISRAQTHESQSHKS